MFTKFRFLCNQSNRIQGLVKATIVLNLKFKSK